MQPAYIESCQTDLDTERQSRMSNLQKIQPEDDAGKVLKSVSVDLLKTKSKLEDLGRFTHNLPFATATPEDKQKIITQISSSAEAIMLNYQTHYIALSHSPATALEFIQAELTAGGFTPDQVKKLKEITKRQEEQREKEEKKSMKVSSSFNRSYSPYPRQSYPTATPNLYQPLLAYPRPGIPFPPPILDRERKRLEIQEMKKNSQCKACSQFGHWKGDPECPRTINALAGYLQHYSS